MARYAIRSLRTEIFSSKQLESAQSAVYVAFFCNAFGWATFIPRIPEVKNEFELTNGQLGITLLVVAVGMLVSMKVSGAIAARLGSARSLRIFSVLLAFNVALLGGLLSYRWFVVTLFGMGVALAGQDIAMNVHGSSVEKFSGRSLMNGFHARFSIGSLVGALVGGICAQLSVSIAIQMAFVALGLFGGFMWVSNRLLPTHIDIHQPESRARKRKKSPLIFWALGLLGFFSSVGEGSAADWGAVLLRETWNVSPFVATVPYVFFAIAMVLGRLNGDRITDIRSREWIVRWGGLVAGVGLCCGLLLGGPIGISLGWLALGVGISVAIPSLFSACVEIAQKSFSGQVSSSAAVAIVGAISYAGFLVGPPLIGWLADIVTLRWAMLVPAILALTMGMSARIVRA